MFVLEKLYELPTLTICRVQFHNVNDKSQNTINFSESNWIIPKATAFVAQIPWIENATLRDNILFGLPFSASRYTTVLKACALSQDIAKMEDGDGHDENRIPCHGVNLSGGQCSRLALARALYSQAEILVFDDIFSAADSHVGWNILEQALTGDLAKNRTRIVAMQHFKLCLSNVVYAILLGNGKVEYAGPPSGFQQDLTTMDHKEIKNKIITILQEKNQSAANSIELGLESAGQESDHATHKNDGFKECEPHVSPRKFHEIENCAKWALKLNVPGQYLDVASGYPWVFWLLVFIVLVG